LERVGTSTLISGYAIILVLPILERRLTYTSQLTDPENNILTRHARESTGSTSITAEKDGRYEYCFSNHMSTVADKKVRYVFLSSRLPVINAYVRLPSFNVHGIIYVPDDGE